LALVIGGDAYEDSFGAWLLNLTTQEYQQVEFPFPRGLTSGFAGLVTNEDGSQQVVVTGKADHYMSIAIFNMLKEESINRGKPKYLMSPPVLGVMGLIFRS